MFQKADILDISIAEEDEDLLGLEEVSTTGSHKAVPEERLQDTQALADDPTVPDVIFRAYDIRGIAKDQISRELSLKIGQALGSEAIDHGQETIIVARDARLSSPTLAEYLIRGILSTGCNVLNIGTVPTPLLYFATNTLKESQSGIMVTASHNPKEYNGYKVVMNGKIRSDDDIKAIRRRILSKDIYSGEGEEKKYDIVPEYVDTIFSDVALAGDVSIVIDAGHGVTGVVAPRLFEELGCSVTPMLCDLDGNFPQHNPDPSVEKNLQLLIAKVKETGADIGVAFDGDGDRLVVVTPKGEIIWPDQLLMMFAKDIVSRNPGADVVFDVKSTRQLASAITSYGGRPIMWKTGHAPMKNKMLESGALLGGEYSGHIFIKDRWFGFDDGMYAAARLIEILSLQGQTLDEMFDEFPRSPSTPEIRVPVPEEKKFEIVQQLADIGNFGEGRVTKIDGVRVDYAFGWGLVRASNTSANLTLRFEADDDESLHKVKSIMVKELRVVAPHIKIDWETA
ncbi:MAG: phosphomannomutase/phosphoglucomutase [Agarilytica sp.]